MVCGYESYSDCLTSCLADNLQALQGLSNEKQSVRSSVQWHQLKVASVAHSAAGSCVGRPVRRHIELEARLEQLQGEYARASTALDAAVRADGGQLAAARAAAEAAAAEVTILLEESHPPKQQNSVCMPAAMDSLA